MDWGDPAYLAEVAQVPARLRAQGVKIAQLVLVGVSYSGFANAQLVATHPELRPTALIMVDSYLDLPARYRALPPGHATKAELERAMRWHARRAAAGIRAAVTEQQPHRPRSRDQRRDALRRCLEHERSRGEGVPWRYLRPTRERPLARASSPRSWAGR